MEWGTPEFEAKSWAANAARNEANKIITVQDLIDFLTNFVEENPDAKYFGIDYEDRDCAINTVDGLEISIADANSVFLYFVSKY